ncbi:MAG: DEAD/DEAH box helicase [bacterium]|nr:DEAD/DEAH box helicase [bacterium]
MSNQLNRGQRVRVPEHGLGEVQADLGDTVIVRFGSEIHECVRDTIHVVQDAQQAFASGTAQPPLEVVARVQAECINSINSTWGMFARSKISLLPHQLWVCRKVLESWPARWLVADDVGLGKTIEAGLILSALKSRGLLERLLILCPASLVEQWQYRLRTMFDLRTSIYSPDADGDRTDFWNTNPRVVASLHTLRIDNNGRQKRLLESEPWDVVLVDEAHHLNADEQAGPTLGFKLVQKLENANRVRSMVFFSGTPHRGKPYGFFSLLSLLRSDEFGAKKPVKQQLVKLPSIMIRNNKQNVTDLHGKQLFQPLVVEPRTYTYSQAEARFYDMLTEFIVSGKAYASRLGGRDGRAVMLVLISMQKLASSSVAAILRALNGRLARIDAEADSIESQRLANQQEEFEENGDLDDAAEIDERLAEIRLRLMKDEKEWLTKLIDAAREVEEETKIQSIVAEIEKLGKSVLLFTEYKATQSLLLSKLIARFGADAVSFINGDEEAREVRLPNGTATSLRVRRTEAADQFNDGKVRFLVSTEAAGEGIDLQKKCHTLIHVDLPWNPMRLHQRVGRLNRYGQTERVQVISFRNPSTVESRIWEKLTEKIEHINNALRQAMADPEDLYQLVLGMTPPKVFRDVFASGGEVPAERFDEWFNRETATFGDADVIDTVKQLVGNCSRFDFQQVSEKLPKVDLPDLIPFMQNILVCNRRQPRLADGELSFKTPDSWMTDIRVLPDYEHMVFDRDQQDGKSLEKLLGVGHVLVDEALKQARDLEASTTALPSNVIESSVAVFKVFERVTTDAHQKHELIFGVQIREDEPMQILKDWQVLKYFSEASAHSLKQMTPELPQMPDH